jgi:TonB family protein
MLNSEMRPLKFVLTPCLILLISLYATAQQNVLEAPEDSRPPNTSTIYENRDQEGDLGPTAPVEELPSDSDQVFTIAEQMPEFEGGQEALMNFIRTNVRYPESAIEQDIQGKVFIEFVVYPNGELGQFKILRGVHSLLDKEAMRVIKATAGKWKPGKQNGKPVAVVFRLPVVFKLQ